MMNRGLTCLALALATALFSTKYAMATDRHFTYSYETGVLSPGHVELEPWMTFRGGRANYYSRFDQRLEFEVGLIPRLQTSVYWNFNSVTEDVFAPSGDKLRQSTTEFSSISSEWKYKLSDPVANLLGSALYLEGTVGPKTAELEAKVLFDKHWRSWLFAANLIGAREWEFASSNQTRKETELGATLAVGYFVLPAFMIGAEAWQLNELEGHEVESSVLFAGPTLAYATEGWWSALSFLPQWFSFADHSPGSRLDLTHQERLQARLLLGLHL